ncbi:hypothetical protein FRB91_003712 [Serendipita sp. 411]|nr:hypothetical protein FRB91_003712 [Serendipita sp. 411]
MKTRVVNKFFLKDQRRRSPSVSQKKKEEENTVWKKVQEERSGQGQLWESFKSVAVVVRGRASAAAASPPRNGLEAFSSMRASERASEATGISSSTKV